MLRLKRQGQGALSFTWRERTSPSKRLVARSIAYSTLLHAAMFLLFRIHVQYGSPPSMDQAPTVFLDADEQAIAVITNKSPEENGLGHLVRAFHLTDQQLPDLSAGCTTVRTKGPAPLSSLPPVPLIPWPMVDEFSPSRTTYRSYPLQIVLQHRLRHLSLVEDGSYMFLKASPKTLLYTPAFSESQPRVEFEVTVAHDSGKIMQILCHKELVDKRLQIIAIKMLKAFRFAIPESAKNLRNQTSGTLTLQFAGTFDTINSLLTSAEDRL